MFKKGSESHISTGYSVLVVSVTISHINIVMYIISTINVINLVCLKKILFILKKLDMTDSARYCMSTLRTVLVMLGCSCLYCETRKELKLKIS